MSHMQGATNAFHSYSWTGDLQSAKLEQRLRARFGGGCINRCDNLRRYASSRRSVRVYPLGCSADNDNDDDNDDDNDVIRWMVVVLLLVNGRPRCVRLQEGVLGSEVGWLIPATGP